MDFTIEQEQESDGRWLAEVPELPGVLAYGATSLEAMSKAEVLALRVIAERIEHSESRPFAINISIPAMARANGRLLTDWNLAVNGNKPFPIKVLDQ